MTRAKGWNDLLTSCNGLFDEPFVTRWSGLVWPPTDDNRIAAAKLHLQLVSRITTQRLPYADGEEATALTSVYQLFGEARDIFKAHPKAAMTDAVTWHVLNTQVRPFTAKWHRLSQGGALEALDGTDIFRDDLARLQPILIHFNELLVAIRDVQELVPPSRTADTDRECAVEKEMGEPLPWGIHQKLGGLPAATADEINPIEKQAIVARRTFYGSDAPPAPKAGDATVEARAAEAWEKRPAAALAISGGGIRSATFALGVLVAFARRNLLYQFDYLSTVSGGGYLGSFLTTFLNTPDPGNAVTDRPPIGLRRADLPFRREDGEAAALRHVRHHSKYLATGRLWERLQMAFAQVYGMAMNGLGFAYLAVMAALAEYVLRQALPNGSWWSRSIVVFTILLALTPIFIPMMLSTKRVRKFADTILASIFLALIVLLAWHGLELVHERLAMLELGWRPWLVLVAVPLLASGVLALAGNLALPVRIVLIVVSATAAPLLFLSIELAAFELMRSDIPLPYVGNVSGVLVALIVAIIGFALFGDWLDINFTAPHRHYKKKLGEAYLVQPDPDDVGAPLRNNVSLKLSDCTSHRAPYHLVNCALNVPASEDPQMQGRLTDFFMFSPGFCGSPLTGYKPTATWEQSNQELDLGTAMAVSGAAAAPQMGTGTIKNLSFWLALFNIRLSYWIRNPMIRRGETLYPPGLLYLLREMFGWADEKRPYINVSDGGHIENLGVYELLRRRCKYIVAIDGEQDPRMTFQGLTTLQRLAAIDLGVKIDIGVDALRLSDKGLSHSHFVFCRIHYPRDELDGKESYGYMMYLKLSLTGNEGEFIRRYRLDEPDFPHHSTADQFFTEAQFEAYRSLGEHVGDKLFLPALVESGVPAVDETSMAAKQADVELEKWFCAVGKNTLDALPEYLKQVRKCRARQNAQQAAQGGAT